MICDEWSFYSALVAALRRIFFALVRFRFRFALPSKERRREENFSFFFLLRSNILSMTSEIFIPLIIQTIKKKRQKKPEGARIFLDRCRATSSEWPDQLMKDQSTLSSLTQSSSTVRSFVRSRSSVDRHRHFYLPFSLNDMIEVNAEILRGPVFIAGETLHCQVTFTNRATTEETNQSK